MQRVSRYLAAVLLAAVLTACAGPADVATTPTPTPSGPPTLTDDELYDLAVSQYQKLDAILIQMEKQGGTDSLPETSHDLMMDPAWTAFSDHYLEVLFQGIKFIGDPQYSTLDTARLTGEDLIEGTVIALQTCELFQGASVVDKDGNTINDGSPVLDHTKVYFKYDSDSQLKVFVLNRKAVDSCPF